MEVLRVMSGPLDILSGIEHRSISDGMEGFRTCIRFPFYSGSVLVISRWPRFDFMCFFFKETTQCHDLGENANR